jgi:hypothetical protein
MEVGMFKLKLALIAAATAGALITSAAVSILDVSTKMHDPTTAAQIDTLDLMSKARDLPTQTIESPF